MTTNSSALHVNILDSSHFFEYRANANSYDAFHATLWSSGKTSQHSYRLQSQSASNELLFYQLINLMNWCKALCLRGRRWVVWLYWENVQRKSHHILLIAPFLGLKDNAIFDTIDSSIGLKKELYDTDNRASEALIVFSPLDNLGNKSGCTN